MKLLKPIPPQQPFLSVIAIYNYLHIYIHITYYIPFCNIFMHAIAKQGSHLYWFTTGSKMVMISWWGHYIYTLSIFLTVHIQLVLFKTQIVFLIMQLFVSIKAIALCPLSCLRSCFINCKLYSLPNHSHPCQNGSKSKTLKICYPPPLGAVYYAVFSCSGSLETGDWRLWRRNKITS